MIPVKRVDEETADLPGEIVSTDPGVDDLLAREEGRGNIHVGEEYVELLNDPYLD